MEIKEIVKEAVIIDQETPFKDALGRMLKEHTNTLLVVDTDGILVGEVSVADLFDGIVPMNFDGDAAITLLDEETEFKAAVKQAADTPTSDFMTNDFRSITPDATFLEVAAIAIGEHKARMPVVDHEGRPIGIISRQGLKQILGKFMNE